MASKITLIHGDCLEVLPTLKAGSVDAVVTDPPYGIGFKYSQHNDTPDGYGEFIWECVNKSESLCSPGSPIFVWQSMTNIRNFHRWFPRDWRIFAAAKNFVQMRPTPMQYSYDPVVVWWTDGDVWAEGTASRDFHVANTNPSCRTKGSVDFVEGHPCPRPLGQVEHIVSQWVKRGGVVIDPYMGSGTTGVACVNLDRDFIGIEIDEHYYNIAKERIEQAQRDKAERETQTEIFPTKRPKQEKLL